ncbi:SAGA complex protein [Mycena vitilis]|nr:SAGA complex protein [Mycena vitilis]
MNNLLRTLTESKAKAAYPETDLKLLLSTVKDGRAHDSKLTDPFYDSLEGLLLELRTISLDNHDAEAFLKPVSKAEVPDYYEVITTPMDLQTMLKKVKQKQYKSKREFKDDLDLIWSNCFTYNATETHPLRQCAKRLKVKGDRLLRNITDRKERADPVIPAALGGGGPSNGHSASSSPFPSKPNGVVNGTPRLPTITIKPPRKSFNDGGSRKGSFSGTTHKRELLVPAQKFEEMPALVRTAEGMRAFAAAEADASPANLRPYLPADLDAGIVKLEEMEEDGADAMMEDVAVGDKRRWNGLDDRPRKRARKDAASAADPHLWWAAVHSDALLPNGLPHLAHRSSNPASSSSFASSSTAHRPRRKRKKGSKGKDGGRGASEKTLLGRMSTNIRTMRRLRHTHARFAALGLGSSGAGAGDDGDAMPPPPAPLPPLGMPPPPLDSGLLAMPELQPPEEEEHAVVGENEVDDRPWGEEIGIGGAGRRRRRKGKGRAVPSSARDFAHGGVGVQPEEEEEEEPAIDVGGANADKCMRWMGSKVLEHAGFQGTSSLALDVLASVTSEYILNVGRTMRYMCDKYSHTMTPEEIILHTLFESGIPRVQDLERYISDDVERYGARLGDLEKKLVGAYREVTAVDLLSDEGLFEDEEEDGGALTMGDFADALGEDYLGLRELGIAAEFGMSSLSIPKKLLRGKKRLMGAGAGHAAPKPPPLPYPLPPPFVPLTAAKVDSQIGLLRPYYMQRFTLVAAATSATAPAPPLYQHQSLPGPSFPSLPGPSLPPLPGPSMPPLPGPSMPSLPGPSMPSLSLPQTSSPSLPQLSGSPGTLPGTLNALPIAMPPPPPPPPPTPAPVILPHMQLPDDAPPPAQAKMGPLGQILLTKMGAKKKVASGSGGGGGGGGGAGGSPTKKKSDPDAAGGEGKKKKKGGTGVGTGNGRKKSANGNGNTLMLPPPVPAPIVAAGI